MQLGVIGLGRMGHIIVGRVFDAGHKVVTFDFSAETVAVAADAGAGPADSVADLVGRLGDDRRIQLMVPAGDAVNAILDDLDPYLGRDDVVVSGGNSHFEESARCAEVCSVTYLDCGTSDGPADTKLGFSLMVGGPRWACDELTLVFDAVATGPDGHDRTDDSGSGHYVKMVRNGVEYVPMQAYGEGFELLVEDHCDLDLESVARTQSDDAAIRSWLLELCKEAFREEGNDLDDADDYVAGGSTDTWTVQRALEQEVPVPLIYQSLAERFGSHADDRFSRYLANRLRYGFGRHEIARKDD